MLRTDVTLCLLNVFTLVQLIYSYNWDIFLWTITNKVKLSNKFYLSITTIQHLKIFPTQKLLVLAIVKQNCCVTAAAFKDEFEMVFMNTKQGQNTT